jgi:hypothetical protein
MEQNAAADSAIQVVFSLSDARHSTSRPASGSANTQWTPKFCINFLKGKCSDQDQCRFVHWSQEKVDQHKANLKAKAAAAPKSNARP